MVKETFPVIYLDNLDENTQITIRENIFCDEDNTSGVVTVLENCLSWEVKKDIEEGKMDWFARNYIEYLLEYYNEEWPGRYEDPISEMEVLVYF